MPDNPTSDANVAPSTDTQAAVVAKAEYDSVVAQLKGAQRASERLRKELQSRIVGEETAERISLLGKKVDMVIDAMEKSGFSDPDIAEKIKKVRADAALAETRLREETEATAKIADIFEQTGVDFDDVEVAKAYWESGKYSKAVEAYERLATKNKNSEQRQDDDDDKLAEEAKARAAAKRVDTNSGTVSVPTDAETGLKRKLAEIDKLPVDERIAARWAVLREHKR